jgi:hypothetical protein
MTDTYAPAIDIATVANNWPPGREMPALIRQLGALMSPWPWGALGHWRLHGESFGSFWGSWCQGGADLDGQFGIFMAFASGRKYAVWYHDDDAAGAHPIVDFGDEGGIAILAPNITSFFSDWANGLGIGWLEPFDYEATPELLATRRAYGAQMLALINAVPAPPAGLPTDVLQARLDATVAAAQKVADESQRQKRLVEPYGSQIDRVSPPKFWPRGQAFPGAIAALGALLEPMINGAVGRYDMTGHRLPENWFDHAADLHDQFGFFLVDHNYRSVAVWYHDGAVPGSEPIVDFRSMAFDADDDAAIAAPDLKAYLTKWADAVAAGDPAYRLNDEPEIAAQRPAFAAHLRGLANTLGDTAAAAPPPDLVGFIRAHIAAARARDAADPVLQHMATLLRAHFPAPDNVISNAIFATVTGDAFAYSLTGQELRAETFPEGAALAPLLRQARTERVRGPAASLGLWTSAQIALHPDGRIALLAYWDE